MGKREILDSLGREWQALMQVLDGVPLEGMERPGVAGEWSVKEVLGHIATWEDETFKAVHADRNSLDLPSYGDVDAWNERDAAGWRRQTLQAVLVEVGGAHQRLVSWVQALPDDALDDPALAAMVGQETAEHYREHREDIEGWLAASRG